MKTVTAQIIVHIVFFPYILIRTPLVLLHRIIEKIDQSIIWDIVDYPLKYTQAFYRKLLGESLMKKCSKCGEEVEKSYVRCPHCGGWC